VQIGKRAQSCGHGLELFERSNLDVGPKITASGMAKDEPPRVFDPFFTTKGVGNGTGQGQSISDTIVARRQLGTIGFEFEPESARNSS
jgi:C4-dicarboxylate-specific signal transduction histidine kinase